MTFREIAWIGCAALAWMPVAVAVAQEASAEVASAESADAELEAAVAYVEALVNNGYPDFAEPVIAETKRRWPSSEAQLFAVEIRGLLSLGRFDEAERRIASLPDRKGTKFWAARLEVANNYFSRNQKPACMKIYDEFFAAFPTPPKDIAKFFTDASYMYGQLLFEDGNYEKAAKVYEGLMQQVKGEVWCNVAAETAKMYMKLADKLGAGKNASALDAAEKVVDKLLWRMDMPVFFGQAVSMKAHIEVMRGNVAGAKEIIEEHRSSLESIHEQIVAADPEGAQGLLRLSPLPECLYLEAKILWDAAQNEYKKPKRDDELVKSYLFGARDKTSGKRDGKGAFNLAVKLFLHYDASPWAPPAGELSEEIKAFAEKSYGANIKTRITPEQIARARAALFEKANDLFNADQYQAAVDAYFELLAKYPEIPESVDAVAHIASALLDLFTEAQDEGEKLNYRLDCDAVEAYLAERFAGHRDRLVMIAGGNAACGAAAKEKERGDPERADRLYRAFCTNYRDHPNAPGMAASRAGEAQKAERWSEAISRWQVVETCFTNSTFYTPALSQMSFCYGKLGDEARQIDYMNRFLAVETSRLRRLQGQMQLAQMYQKSGLAILAGSETNTTPEAVAAAERAGSAQIIRAIQQFSQFSDEAQKAIDDPATTKEDRARFVELREAAMFLVGECYARITKPEAALGKMRVRAAESYEAYVAAHPEGRWVKAAFVRLGTIYTAMGELEKSKDALDRLTRLFPDSDEAKNAKPRLAKSLIEMGMKKEGTDIYAEMLHTDGKYTAGQYLNAGEALIDARSWDLANQAFEKAIRLAGTNQVTLVARARLGEAKTSFKQGSLAEAREALDIFLSDPNMSKRMIAADAYFMMVEVASEQGRNEHDATMRAKHFNAAIGALGKVRNYWANRQPWERDRLELLSGDIQIRRMRAEEAMGLKDEARESCGQAASKFLTFIQAHGPTESRPFSQLAPEEQANLEEAYGKAVEMWSLQGGADRAEFVIRYGEEYLRLFADGPRRTAVINFVNQARADLPATAGSEPTASAE